MSDTLSTEVKPVKNAFGLPTGELHEGSLFEEAVEEVEEPIQEEVIDEPVQEEVVEEPEEEDILSFISDEPEVPEAVSEDSELDKLRRQVGILEGRLEEQREFLDRGIKEEAQETPEEEELDFSNPQFREAIGEKLQEDPSLVPVLLEQMMDRKLKAQAKKLEALEAQKKETDVSIEQANALKKNFYEGLSAAQELGDVERRLVEEISEAVASRNPTKSHVLTYLSQNPEFTNSPEGIKAAVTNLAAKARANAVKKGIDISKMSKAPASDRENRMLDKQTKPAQEEDYDSQKINSLLSKGKSPLDSLLKGR